MIPSSNFVGSGSSSTPSITEIKETAINNVLKTHFKLHRNSGRRVKRLHLIISWGWVLVQLATTAHGFRSIIQIVNMYVKHLPTTLIGSLQNCFCCCFQSLISFPVAQFKNYNVITTHAATGSFAEHYCSKQISSHSVV